MAFAPTASLPGLRDRGRLEAVVESGLLDDDDIAPALDRWTRLARDLVGVPSAVLMVLDEEFAWTKSHAGLDPEIAERGVPHAETYCQHVVSERRPFVVEDAEHDPRVMDNVCTTEGGLRAYAGVPVAGADGQVLGSFCVFDAQARTWTSQELGMLEDLAAGLVAEIRLRTALRASIALQEDFARQARIDVLTGLPNRRELESDLAAAVAGDGPCVLAMFDLDGFKLYNDAYGHPAGDALLSRLGKRLAVVVAPGGGRAYRLGGDEFCVLVDDETAVEAAAEALREQGDGFVIGSSHGCCRLDETTLTVEQAMQIVDQRLYGRKRGRADAARQQAQDVLTSVLREREPGLDLHVRVVAMLARRVGEELGMTAAEIEEVEMAAQMHDIGKVAVPDSILAKPGPLDEEEWAIMRRHTLNGERILAAAPALREVATIVRSSHERWDGAGYPDGLAGIVIPLAARVVLACDAFDAMTSERPYAAPRLPAAAVRELRACAGMQFDPRVVEALAAVIAAG